MQLLQEISNFIYPSTCVHCEAVLTQQEELLCLRCLNDLDEVFSPDTPDAIKHLFSAKVRPDQVITLYRFGQGSVIQSLMHELKYHGRFEVSLLFGDLLSRKLKPTLANKDWHIVPVPLHPSKKDMRGFNQSEEIARTLAHKTSWKMEVGLLERSVKGQTLTKLNRSERAELTQTLYRMKRKHNVPISVILLDDVLTTGATLNACGQLLREQGVQNLILTTIAVADH